MAKNSYNNSYSVDQILILSSVSHEKEVKKEGNGEEKEKTVF